MSAPRAVEKGKTYMLSRRTTARFFLLRPDASGVLQNIMLYCLGVFVTLFGIEVHTVTVLSNHVHVVLTDTQGNFPLYLERCHRAIALCVKCYRGWDGSVFDRCQTSMVELPTAAAIIEKMAYVIVNPVAAGAVYHARDWPGVRTLIDDIGRRTFRATRPPWFVHPKRWPAEVFLKLVWPDAVLAEMTEEQARDALKEAVARLEKQARAEARRAGQSFLGPRRSLRAPVTTRATESEPWRKSNPTFATAGDAETYDTMMARRRAFREGYRIAYLAFGAGDRDVLFPPGTWQMRVRHHVCLVPS
jgi:hypothetical protein